MPTDSETVKARYRTEGYLVLPDVFPASLVAELREVTGAFVKRARSGDELGELFDVITAPPGGSRLRRIYSPEAVHPVYDRAMRFDPLLDIIEPLLGGSIRFDHGKLNFKPPGGGAAVEWHQDWAYYPQTNDDMLAVGIMLEDCNLDNGPLMVVPGSHRGPVYDHHQRGTFVGGVDAAQLTDVLPGAVPLVAPAGSITVHHVRMLHASTANRSQQDRPLLLFNYAAVDAFPIFDSFEWDAFNYRILRGEPTSSPRVVANPVRIALPKPERAYATGSLFDLQEEMSGTLYAEK